MVNIFFTNANPVTAAKDPCDSYVVKIPIEVALLLSAIHWRTGYDGSVSSGMPVVIVDGEVVSAVGPYRDSKVIKYNIYIVAGHFVHSVNVEPAKEYVPLLHPSHAKAPISTMYPAWHESQHQLHVCDPGQFQSSLHKQSPLIDTTNGWYTPFILLFGHVYASLPH